MVKSVVQQLSKTNKVNLNNINSSSNAVEKLKQSQNLNRTIGEKASDAASYFGSAALSFPGDLVFGVGGDTIKGLASPISTAQGIASIVTGLPSLIPGIEGNDEALNSASQYVYDQYGTFENFKESFRTQPATTLADLSLVLGAARGATKLGSLGNKTPTADFNILKNPTQKSPSFINKQKAEKLKTAITQRPVDTLGQAAGQLGRAIDPITPLRATGRFTGKAADAVGAKFLTPVQSSGTGVPIQALEIARQSGRNKDFVRGRQGKVTQSEIVEDAEAAFKLKEKTLTDNLNLASARARLADIPADARMIRGVEDAVEKTFAKYSSQTTRFLLKPVEKNHLERVIGTEMVDFFTKPQAQNALGLQEIIRGLDRQFPGASSAKAEARAVHAELRNNVREVLENHPDIPNDYKTALSEFSDGQIVLDTARTELGLGKRTGSKKTVYDKIKGTFLETDSITEGALRALPDAERIINKMAGKLVSEPIPSQFLRVSSGLGAGAGGAGLAAGGGFLLGAGAGLSSLGAIPAAILGFGSTYSPKFASGIQRNVGAARAAANRFGQSATAEGLRNIAPLARASGQAQDEIFEPIGTNYYGLARGLL